MAHLFSLTFGKAMASLFVLFSIFSLLLLASDVNGRNVPEEYWKDVLIVEQTSGEEIGGLLDSISAKLSPHEKGTKNCDLSSQAKDRQEDHFDKDFEPRPNLSAYEGDDVEPKKEKKDSFVKDFEQRPNLSIYKAEGKEEKDSFAKDFEPRHNISIYKPEGKEEKDSFVKDSKPRPNVSIHKPEEEEKKHFLEDFEPRPSATNYEG